MLVGKALTGVCGTNSIKMGIRRFPTIYEILVCLGTEKRSRKNSAPTHRESSARQSAEVWQPQPGPTSPLAVEVAAEGAEPTSPLAVEVAAEGAAGLSAPLASPETSFVTSTPIRNPSGLGKIEQKMYGNARVYMGPRPDESLMQPLTGGEAAAFDQFDTMQELHNLMDNVQRSRPGHHHLELVPEALQGALSNDRFLRGEQVLLIDNAGSLPGFQESLSGTSLVTETGFPSQLFACYTDIVRVRSHRIGSWEDSIEEWPPAEAAQRFHASKNDDQPTHTPCNVIDMDSGLQDATRWSLPDAIRNVSLNEQVASDLPADVLEGGARIARYLLVSQGGAVTFFHTDFSATSVFYFVVRGVKVFHVIRPTPNNRRLFRGFMELEDRHRRFFGSHPELDGGGCRRVVVTQRQAICMPAGVIHCVETVGDSVALG